jgi:hypothetical protein
MHLIGWLKDNAHSYPNGESILKDTSDAIAQFPTMQISVAEVSSMFSSIPVNASTLRLRSRWQINPPR